MRRASLRGKRRVGGPAQGGAGNLMVAAFDQAKRALFRVLLARITPADLTNRELLLMVDLLDSALAVGDSSADLGE